MAERRRDREIDVRAMREKLHVSTVELAALLGVTKGLVSHWETGKTFPSVSAAYMIRRLAEEVEHPADLSQKDNSLKFSIEIKLTAEPALLAVLERLAGKLA